MERELFASVGLRDTSEEMFSVWCIFYVNRLLSKLL